MKTPLCKCTNCDTIMYDENPQVNAIQYLVREGKTDLNRDIETMVKVDEYWVCPKCNTDDYLVDL